MEDYQNIVNFISWFLIVVSPVIFVIGVILLITEHKYRKLEEILGREIGGIRKMVFPKLEVTIYTLQERLLTGRLLLGWFFIFFSLLFFLAALKVKI